MKVGLKNNLNEEDKSDLSSKGQVGFPWINIIQDKNFVFVHPHQILHNPALFCISALLEFSTDINHLHFYNSKLLTPHTLTTFINKIKILQFWKKNSNFHLNLQGVSLLSEKSKLLILISQSWFIYDSLGSNWPQDVHNLQGPSINDIQFSILTPDPLISDFPPLIKAFLHKDSLILENISLF